MDKALNRGRSGGIYDIGKQLALSNNTITSGLESAISSGNWIIKRFRMDRKGVTQASSLQPLPMGTKTASYPKKLVTWLKPLSMPD